MIILIAATTIVNCQITQPLPANPVGWVLSAPKGGTVRHADGAAEPLYLWMSLYPGDQILTLSGGTASINGFGNARTFAVRDGYTVNKDLLGDNSFGRYLSNHSHGFGPDDLKTNPGPIGGPKKPPPPPKPGPINWGGGSVGLLSLLQGSNPIPDFDVAKYMTDLTANVKDPEALHMLKAQAYITTYQPQLASFELSHAGDWAQFDPEAAARAYLIAGQVKLFTLDDVDPAADYFAKAATMASPGTPLYHDFNAWTEVTKVEKTSKRTLAKRIEAVKLKITDPKNINSGLGG